MPTGYRPVTCWLSKSEYTSLMEEAKFRGLTRTLGPGDAAIAALLTDLARDHQRKARSITAKVAQETPA